MNRLAVSLFWDAFGLAIAEPGKGEVMGRVSCAKGGSYDLFLFPAKLCDCPIPDGWHEGEMVGGVVHYTCRITEHVEAVEECLYQVLTALEGYPVIVLGLGDRGGYREMFTVKPGEARDIAKRAAQAVKS